MEADVRVRDIINIVLKGKKFIIGVTLIATLLGALLNYFVISPTYEVSTSVMVNNQSSEQQKATINMNSFAGQVKSSLMINKIIQKLKLDTTQFTIHSISNNITVTNAKDSNMIVIKVRGKNPETISQIANVVVLELGTLIEVSTRLDMIVGIKKRLLEVEDYLKITQKEIDETSKQLQAVPEKLTTKKVLADDPYLQSVAADNRQNTNRALGALQLNNEEINPVYTTLKSRFAESTINASKLEEEKKNLDARLADNQKSIEDIQRLTNSFDLKSDQLILSSNRFNAVLITPTLLPELPVAPNKLVNTIIFSILGGLLSIFIVVFRQYWVDTKDTSRS